MNEKRLQLNNKYSLYFDNDRFLLGPSRSNEDDNFYMPIHPLHARLFSFFDGKKSLNKTIVEIALFFSISTEDVRKLILPFINNENPLPVKFANNYFSFPSKLLIESYGSVRVDLDISKSTLTEPYDLKRNRLSIPKSILFVINSKCATDCIYCYADRKTKYKPLSTSRILEIIDEANTIGIHDFDISGGEFLLHEDWQQIVKKALSHGYTDGLSTKVPISKNVIDDFEIVGLKELQVSLDSLNPKLLKKTLHVSDNYCENIKETIKYLDAKGIDLIIKGTQTKYTCDVDNIKNVMDFLKELKNVKRYLISVVGYSHFKTVAEFHQFKPTKPQILELGKFLKECENSVPYDLVYDDNINLKSSICNYSNFKNRGLCTGNVYGFVVLPDGKVTICEELYWNKDFIIGDLSTQSIMEVWNSKKALDLWNIQQSQLSEMNPCKKCQDFDNCRRGLGVCWKSVVAHYGKENYQYPDPSCPRAPEPLKWVYYDFC